MKSPSLLLGLRLADVLGVDPRYLALGEMREDRLDAIERRLERLEKRRTQARVRRDGARSYGARQ